MAFRDFQFPDVEHDLGLTFDEAELFDTVAALEPAREFLERMRSSVEIGLAISTEKAKSEFIIAPILGELRHTLGRTFGIFSGIEFNVDASRGLNGYCDFILTRSPMQIVLRAPVVAIAEAKNDNLTNGYGQCIAAMVAACEFNARAGTPISPVYGAVTTGTAWKFLRLAGDVLTFDRHEYNIAELGHILGILAHVLKGG